MRSATKFIPTPRPASFVALAAVENPRLEPAGIDLLRVQAVSLFRRDESLFERDLLDALRGQALAIILDRGIYSRRHPVLGM